MKILFCASEVYPFAKTGGLADVAGSLPAALSRLGDEVLVMTPKYRGTQGESAELAPGVQVRFIENEAYFNRSGLYGNDQGDYPDNLKRFSFFCHEALRICEEMRFQPDILHAHDWQAALMPVILKTRLVKDRFFAKTRSVLTIHNLAYQGHFPAKQFADTGLDESLFKLDGFEFYGKINVLKAGILYADALSTVSSTYAKEIKTAQYGFGLDGVIRAKKKNVRGILNGLDCDLWDPERDPKIQKNYSAKDMTGKRECKTALQSLCRFEADEKKPVFTMITRLAEQKGLDLFTEIADEFLSMEAQFVLLGEGDRVYHTAFKNIAARHPKNAAVFLGFNAENAHGLYAGADFFLMPSYFEPCGLGQMIAMRYGTVPVVRRTGGLADTVTDAGSARANGFSFNPCTGSALLKAMKKAMQCFRDPVKMAALRKQGMALDLSWDKSANEYLGFYGQVKRS